MKSNAVVYFLWYTPLTPPIASSEQGAFKGVSVCKFWIPSRMDHVYVWWMYTFIYMWILVINMKQDNMINYMSLNNLIAGLEN